MKILPMIQIKNRPNNYQNNENVVFKGKYNGLKITQNLRFVQLDSQKEEVAKAGKEINKIIKKAYKLIKNELKAEATKAGNDTDLITYSISSLPSNNSFRELSFCIGHAKTDAPDIRWSYTAGTYPSNVYYKGDSFKLYLGNKEKGTEGGFYLRIERPIYSHPYYHQGDPIETKLSSLEPTELAYHLRKIFLNGIKNVQDDL